MTWSLLFILRERVLYEKNLFFCMLPKEKNLYVREAKRGSSHLPAGCEGVEIKGDLSLFGAGLGERAVECTVTYTFVHMAGRGQKNGDQHSEVMRRGWLWRLDGEGERKGRRLMFTSDGGGGGGW